VKQRRAAQLHRNVCRAHVNDRLGGRRGRCQRRGAQLDRRLVIDGGRRVGHVQVQFVFCDIYQNEKNPIKRHEQIRIV